MPFPFGELLRQRTPCQVGPTLNGMPRWTMDADASRALAQVLAALDEPQKPTTMSTKSTLAIALTALAAGAALGVLLAPASGADTRKKLVKKGNDLKDQLADLMDQGKDLIGELKGEAQDAASKMRDAAQNGKERIKEKVDETASAARTAAQSNYKS